MCCWKTLWRVVRRARRAAMPPSMMMMEVVGPSLQRTATMVEVVVEARGTFLQSTLVQVVLMDPE